MGRFDLPIVATRLGPSRQLGTAVSNQGIVPEAERVISYRVPAFRVEGRIAAGIAAFKDRLSYLPFSGSVLGQLADELGRYTMTTSSLHFAIDSPLAKPLVRTLIFVRLAEAGQHSG